VSVVHRYIRDGKQIEQLIDPLSSHRRIFTIGNTDRWKDWGLVDGTDVIVDTEREPLSGNLVVVDTGERMLIVEYESTEWLIVAKSSTIWGVIDVAITKVGRSEK